MRRLFLALCVMLLPTAANAASSIATSWPTNAYALTDGATITVPCPGSVDASGVGASGFYTLTVLGNNHAISLPSCSIPSPFLFRIVQGAGGPYTGLTFTAGSNTVNSPPVGVYSQTQTAGAIDDVGGQVVSSGVWDFFAPQYGLVPPPAFAIPAGGHDPGSSCASQVSSCLSGQINVTNGDNYVVTVLYCNTATSGCLGSTGGTTVTGVTKSSGGGTIGTCHQMTGVAGSESTTPFTFVDVWVCAVTGTGTLISSVALSGTNNRAPRVASFDVSGTVAGATSDDGVGAHASGTTTPAVVTSGSTSQTGEFVFNVVASQSSSTLTASSGYTTIENADNSIPFLTQWKVSGPPGTQTISSAINGTDYQAAIMAFKHP